MAEDKRTMEYLYSIYDEYQFDNKLKNIQSLRSVDAMAFVPGSGSYVPRAIFIGMAPGAVERKNRRPLSGKIGAKFELMLNDAGLLRSDIFVTNIIKFPLPSHRGPNSGEIRESLPYLRREVNLLGKAGCRTIVAMGLAAYQTLADSKAENVGGMRTGGEWTTYSIDDPRDVLPSKDANRIKLLQLRLNSIGRHVNDMVE